MDKANLAHHSQPEIIDIRREELDQPLLKLLLDGLESDQQGVQALPTLLLYDEAGLKLFEDITYLDEYYLTNAEIGVLEKHARDIAERIPDGSRLVELGSGNLRKVDILLRAFEEAEKAVEYFALDLSLSELHRTLAAIPSGTYRFVKFAALHGTYDDGLTWLKRNNTAAKTTCVLSLGSSIGNFSRADAAKFLNQFARELKPQDMIIVGVDSCQDAKKIFQAYNDSKGVTQAFYRNGLTHANRLLGYEGFKQSEWDVVGSYNDESHFHEAYYSAKCDVQINGIKIPQGTHVHLETANKYSEKELSQLWQASGLIHQAAYGNEGGDYKIHVLCPPPMELPTKPEVYASSLVPSLRDWQELWAAWDAVTLCMTPEEELLSKPIELRNPLIFYLGHVPGFCDIQISKVTGGELTEPAEYAAIFERGVDPDVDNPELCHEHSVIPEVWPSLGDILQYQGKVRNRVCSLIASGDVTASQAIGHSVWLAFEHEAMHLETYLYMLVQSSKATPPPGSTMVDFEKLGAEAERNAVPNEWFRVPASEVKLGLDHENDRGLSQYFSWDNEKPARDAIVKAFEAQGRPISNGDYVNYLKAIRSTSIPASWVRKEAREVQSMGGSHQHAHANGFVDGHYHHRRFCGDGPLGDVSVRTVYGPIPLEFAVHWPLMASYDELAAYAKWVGGRIPTLEEARSLYFHVEASKPDSAEKVSSRLISAVNGHLSNNGVEETPPPASGLTGVPEKSGKHKTNPRDETFINLEGCNVGFANWSPTPVTQNGNRLCGQSDMGGAWEWTSTLLEKWDGFQPQDSYPGYTADFFDGKHNIILGGSWATHPRIAGRKTFINWYQRNYPYTWAGARVVRDITTVG